MSSQGWRRRTELALGDSEYNRQELQDLGFANTGVLPIAVDTDRLTARRGIPCSRTFSMTDS